MGFWMGLLSEISLAPAIINYKEVKLTMAPRLALRRGIELGGSKHKDVARHLNIDPTTLSKILNGHYEISPDLKPKLAKKSIAAGMAIAHEDTRYYIFEYIQGDRHPQTMLRRVEKEDHEADAAMRGIAWRTIDKNHAGDLTPEDRIALQAAGKELIDRAKADLQLVIEWEERYKLGLIDYLTGTKESTRECESRAAFRQS